MCSAPAFAAPSTTGPSARPCTRRPAVTRTRLTIQSASRQATRTRRTTSSSHVAHTWPSLKAAATHVLDRELRRVGDEHDGHHAGLDRIAHHDIRGVGHRAGHISAENENPCLSDLAHRVAYVAAHDRPSP